MSRVDTLIAEIALDWRGKFGYAGGFGRISMGYNAFGFYSPYAGIVQRRHRHGKTFLSRSKFYRSLDPNTTAQQTWRAKLGPGWTAWRALSDAQKLPWNKQGKERKIGGGNAFMSYWLRSH